MCAPIDTALFYRKLSFTLHITNRNKTLINKLNKARPCYYISRVLKQCMRRKSDPINK